MIDKNSEALTIVQRAPVVIPDATNLRTFVTDLMNSQFFKAVASAPQGIAIVLYGQALGLEPTVAMQTIQPVNGRLCVSTTVLQALFQRKGGRIKVLERSDERARVEFRYADWDPYIHEYTQQDAKDEELWDKANWKKGKKRMLLYRCISGGLKVYDPGSHLGIITTEEMEDYPNGLPDDARDRPEAEKAPERAPEAPKAAPPSPEGSPKAKPAAKASPDASTAKKQAIPKASAAPKDGFELEPEPGDDIAAMAEHSESKSDEDILVDSIKAALEAKGVDVKEFKEWLFEFQKDDKMKLHPNMVVKLGKNLRFHGGVREDLEYLKAQLGGAVDVFRHFTSKGK
jgi:hypothetical protein